jgi:hypothetical protein
MSLIERAEQIAAAPMDAAQEEGAPAVRDSRAAPRLQDGG